MRDSLPRPSPVPPRRTPRAARISSEELRHRAFQLWSRHWHGAHAPAWASRDAFLAASAFDPALTVESWLAVTEARAAWIAVELALPAGRVRYLAHRSWEAWWPIWRIAAPRLGSYPIAALASWLDASVRKGAPVDPRPHLAAPHPPDPALLQETMRKRWGASAPASQAKYVPGSTAGRRAGRVTPSRDSRAVLVITSLVLVGLAVLLWARQAGEVASLAQLSHPGITLSLGLLGTALGLLHCCAPLDIGEDEHLRLRRLWPMSLAILTWLPFVRLLV